jgi:hypothetical protein
VRAAAENPKLEDSVSTKTSLQENAFAKNKGSRAPAHPTEEKKNLLLKIAKTAGSVPAALQQEKRRRK